ncbi:N5-glutamine methyltransferase family protein [Streptomyces nanshensis]|uniref:Methyltransferase small domain-containing protein n=1 Tax=Streptomyces nanshensis TaxID=518642 RepID=A0A1E7L4Y0_9ACTN|nr:HemK/PrmC family methyltransferase [Streptomyces nanshensis]OEV11239.1 hypothetical protein AN218_13880 [Streptomyces nanshensis]
MGTVTAAEEARAVEQARARLTEAGVWDVEGDVAALADRFLGGRRPERSLARFEAAVTERCARIPLGHITGSVTFDGLELLVGSGVFVPREESTPLVEWAAGEKTLPHGGRVLDLCSGVGALGLALSARRGDAEVVCVERDDTAVQYLRRNAARHADVLGSVQVRAADLTEPDCLAAHRGVTDLVVANPPYVAPHIRLLPEWADHQPSAALYSGEDGLDLIRRIAVLAAEVLRPDGRLALEHDRAQPDAVQQTLADGPFTDISTFADTAGEPRITVARFTGRGETS